MYLLFKVMNVRTVEKVPNIKTNTMVKAACIKQAHLMNIKMVVNREKYTRRNQKKHEMKIGKNRQNKRADQKHLSAII